MFFDAERIIAVREMILAETRKGPPRRAGQAAARCSARISSRSSHHGGPAGHHPPARSAAARIPAAHRKRHRRSGQSAVRHRRRRCAKRARELHEFNPMLGHRGCRLGVTYPEIYEMQARAIFEAACDVAKKKRRQAVVPEIMIPLVGDAARARTDEGAWSMRPRRPCSPRRQTHRLSRRHDDRTAARR
jgi:pyruvate,orthophosphate dikinase